LPLSFGSSKSGVGLEIGSSSFRVAELQGSSQSPTLTNCGFVKVPRGAVVGGEIVDTEVVSYTLSELWRKVGLREKKVIIGIGNQKVVIRVIELPYMEKQELKSALQFQAQDYIPIPIEEVILDYEVIDEFTRESGERMLQVLLVAAQREMIQNVVQAAEGAGLKPEVIDVSAFAISRVLLPPQPEPSLAEEPKVPETVALVNVGAGISSVVIVEGRVVRFARVIALAGDDWTEAIADSFGITFEEAEELKVKIGLPPLVGDRFMNLPSELLDKAEMVQDVLEREVTRFIGEVKRSFDYYLAQSPVEIKRVLVTGGAAKLKHFVSYLEKALEVEVSYGKPLERVQLSPRLSREALEEDELSLAIPIGLALRGLR
jgi:type IV pilus assembly protein PilM